MHKIIWNGLPLLGPLTGVGNYTAQLLKSLVENSQKNFSIRLFLDSKSIDLRSPVEVDELSIPDNSLGSNLSAIRHSQIRTQRRLVGWFPFLRTLMRYGQGRRFNFHSRNMGAPMLYHEPNTIPFPYDGPIIVTVHDLSFLRHPETHPRERVNFLQSRIMQTLETAVSIVTVSRFVAGEIEHYFGQRVAKKVTVIPNGVSSIFRVRDALETRISLEQYRLAHRRYFLCVGTLEPRKNLPVVIQAYRDLPQRLKQDYPLVLVGALGWGNSDLQNEITRNQIEGIRYLGYLSQENLARLFSGATLLIYPSIYEGFGLPALEAMASGVPVLAANTSSLPEVIGDTGGFFEALDPIQLKALILDYVENKQLWEQSALGGLARAREFTWGASARALLRLYQTLIG